MNAQALDIFLCVGGTLEGLPSGLFQTAQSINALLYKLKTCLLE